MLDFFVVDGTRQNLDGGAVGDRDDVDVGVFFRERNALVDDLPEFKVVAVVKVGKPK
jgi:hypothetical protein